MSERIFIIAILSTLIILTVPTLTYSHGAGESLEAVVDGNFIDIGYQPSFPEAGKAVVLDFSLTDDGTGEPVDFGSVWVRISKEERTFFASGIASPPIGKPVMTVVLPEEGEYQLSVRFQEGRDTVVEAQFPLKVSKSEEGSANSFPIIPSLAGGIVGLLVGIVGISFFRK